MFSVMWSEHCSYKSSKPLLRTLPTRGEGVVAGPGENAGVVSIGDGLAVAFKLESHNHPSAVEPYQGAATGVGGILRDIFTMGARPIAVLDALRFGDPAEARTRHLVDGVVRGVGGYGNCVGVPTVGGELVFDPSYADNPLVNVMAIGAARGAPPDARRGARARATSPSCSGARPAATASGERRSSPPRRSRTTDASKRPSVQVGDPFAEKLLIEASLELIERGLVEGLQDLGAAGITCATSETADRAGTGHRRRPRRDPAARAGHGAVRGHDQREPGADARDRPAGAVRGRRGDLRALGPAVRGHRAGDRRRRHHGRRGRADADGRRELAPEIARSRPRPDLGRDRPRAAGRAAGAAARARPRRAPRSSRATSCRSAGMDPGAVLLALLGSPNLASRRAVFEQYDSTVQAATVAGPRAAARPCSA